MTLEEFYEKLKTEITTDYIVKLKYKYDFEKEYTYSNELLTTDINCDYVWLNDWNEGQTDVEVLEYIAVEDVRKNIHGEWTHEYVEDEEPMFRHRWICSACGDWNGYGEADFCPHCGADMRGETK